MHHAMHLWRQVSVRMPENRQLERRQISEEARLLVRALWRASDVPRPLAHPPGASVSIQFTFSQSLHFVNLLRLLCRALHTFVCAINRFQQMRAKILREITIQAIRPIRPHMTCWNVRLFHFNLFH